MVLADTLNSYIESVKNFWATLDIKSWSAKVGGSSAEAVQAAVYFGIFFSVGFLFKKYFKFLFGCIIVAIIAIKIMEYNALITIDWVALKKTAGMGVTEDLNALMNTAFNWIKQNILLFVASSVGFLIGYKLG